MNIELLNTVAELAEELGHIFIATSNTEGVAHLAASGKLELNHEGMIEVTSWFCPVTVDNLNTNSNVTLLVWDAKTDKGYQLIGEQVKVEELHMLNGYAPDIENKSPIPQIERKLIVRVNKITEFKHAPHADIEI